MRQIEEPSRVTPVMAETDVLVVGSGPGADFLLPCQQPEKA